MSIFLMLIAACAAIAQSNDPFASMPTALRLSLAVPGLPQMYLGEPEGTVYASIGIPALAAGVGLSTWYLLGDKAPGDAWKRDLGFLSSEIGASFSAYSAWAWFRDSKDTGGYSELRTGRESYLQLLSAPFGSGFALDYRILPVVGLEAAAFLSVDTLGTMGKFFSQSSAEFMGISMPTPVALASEIAFAMAANLFVAVTEEALFRGVVLEQFGPLVASLGFGAVHALNLLFAPDMGWGSILKVGMQTGLAILAGYYLSEITIDRGYDIRTAIAYHYWHNVLAMVTTFMYENGKKASPPAAIQKYGASFEVTPGGVSLTLPLR